jgi:hypothetical protein
MKRHWPLWPWSPEALALPDFLAGVRALVRQTQGLPLAGWETSCRMGPDGARSDRLLVGFDLAGVAASRLTGLVHELAMPARWHAEFLGSLHQAAHIMLAIERHEQRVEWRVYQCLRPDSVLAASGLAMRGFKWFADAGVQQPANRITDYWRLPMAAAPLQDWLAAGSGVPEPARPAYAVMGAALRLALRRQPGGRLPDFLVVSEQGAARASCCLRLYESGLLGSDLVPEVDALLAHWAWSPERRAQAMRPWTDRPVGWLAAGLDRTQQAFLTVYSEAQRDDASHALVNGNRHATAQA